MGFGRNPHVAKAQASEQKAEQAGDDAAREMAWREAAHLWERAADREQDGKRKTEYEQKAKDARERAEGSDGEAAEEAEAPAGSSGMLN